MVAPRQQPIYAEAKPGAAVFDSASAYLVYMTLGLGEGKFLASPGRSCKHLISNMVSRKKRRPSRLSARRSGAGERGSSVPARRSAKALARATRPRARGLQAAVGNAHEKQRIDAHYQALITDFEGGVRLFQKQNYSKARGIFEKLVSAAPLEISCRARTYLRMCEQKLRPTEPQARGPRQHYDLGIAYLNARQLDAALDCLTKAQKSGMDQDPVLYAMAAVYALRGNTGAALEHLSAAVQRRPGNRFLAANDEDFASLARHPEFRRLIRTKSA